MGLKSLLQNSGVLKLLVVTLTIALIVSAVHRITNYLDDKRTKAFTTRIVQLQDKVNKDELDVAMLKGEVLVRGERVRSLEQELAKLKKFQPNLKHINQTLSNLVVDDEDLIKQALHILGPYNVTRIQLGNSCVQ